MPQFMQALTANPSGFATAGTALQSAAEQIRAVSRGFSSGNNTALAQWKGAAQQRAESLARRVTNALSNAATHTSEAGSAAAEGGNVLQGLVTQLRTLVQSAQSTGFLVFPDGQVLPGPTHHAQAAAAGPAAGAVLQTYQAIARSLAMGFNSLVQSVTAADQATAQRILGIAMQLDSRMPFASSVRAPQWFGNPNNEARGRIGEDLTELWTRLNGETTLGTERRIRREPGDDAYIIADRITIDPQGRLSVYEVKTGSGPLSSRQSDILPRLLYGGPEVDADGMAPHLPRGKIIEPGEVTVCTQRWDVDTLPESVRSEIYHNGRSIIDIYNGRAGQQAQQELKEWMGNAANRVDHTLRDADSLWPT